MPANILEYIVRLRGGGAAAAQLRVFRRELRNAETDLGGVAKGQYAANAAWEAGRVRSKALRASVFALVAAYSAFEAQQLLVQGLKFDATIEQTRVAFGGLLGSVQAANQEVGFLWNLAKNTPFQFAQVTSAARRLLAFGLSAKTANRYLQIISDTISNLGGGTDEIDRMVLAIGQIASKTKPSAQELRQLGELGIPAGKILQKQLHLTGNQVQNIGRTSITSSQELRALMRGLQQMPGVAGASARQMNTFNGQLSTLKDNFNQLLGAMTNPLFNWLRNHVFPDLNREMGKAQNQIKAGKSSWSAYSGAVSRMVSKVPFWIKAIVAFKLALLGLKAATALSALFMIKFAKIVSAVKLISAIYTAGRAVGFFTATVIALDLALAPIGIAGALIGGAIFLLAAAFVVAYIKIKPFRNAVQAVLKAIIGIVKWVAKLPGKIFNYIIHPGKIAGGIGHLLFPGPHFAAGGVMSRPGLALVGERGPELVDLPGGAVVHPNGSSGWMGGDIVLKVGSSELARVYRKEIMSQLARR